MTALNVWALVPTLKRSDEMSPGRSSNRRTGGASGDRVAPWTPSTRGMKLWRVATTKYGTVAGSKVTEAVMRIGSVGLKPVGDGGGATVELVATIPLNTGPRGRSSHTSPMPSASRSD